jgi:hypothetical protein
LRNAILPEEGQRETENYSELGHIPKAFVHSQKRFRTPLTSA